MHLTQILCLSLLNKFFDSKKTQLLPAKENKKKSFGYVKNKRSEERKMPFHFITEDAKNGLRISVTHSPAVHHTPLRSFPYFHVMIFTKQSLNKMEPDCQKLRASCFIRGLTHTTVLQKWWALLGILCKRVDLIKYISFHC